MRNFCIPQLNEEGSRGQLQALPEAAGREGGSEFIAPQPAAWGIQVAKEKKKVGTSVKCARTPSVKPPSPCFGVVLF